MLAPLQKEGFGDLGQQWPESTGGIGLCDKARWSEKNLGKKSRVQGTGKLTQRVKRLQSKSGDLSSSPCIQVKMDGLKTDGKIDSTKLSVF